MPPSLRSATSTTASIGSRVMSCAMSRPENENATWPTSTGTSVMMPSHGARTTPRSRSASAAASDASAALYCDSRLTSSSRGSAPVSISRRLASSSVFRCVLSARACLIALCLARLGGQARADVVLLDAGPAPHLELGDDAAGARREHHLAVGFGAARQHELARMRHHRDLGHGDAERLLGLRFAG